MSCGDNIASQEYIDILLRYRGSVNFLEQYSDICYQKVDENWAVLYLNINDIPPLNYGTYGYYTIPKLYGLMDQESMAESGILKVQNQSALSLKGRGVLIGFVDTGIDYLHEAFLDELGNTRLLSIWDQSAQGEGAPTGFDYGIEYDRAQINRAIRSQNPYEIVPQRDDIGHGTFVAGIAAGSRTNDSFAGAAPQSSIIAVKLRQAKKALKDFHQVQEAAIAYSESDIMLGISYLTRKAAEFNMPLVINFGMGSSMGPHTGGSVLSQYLSQAANMANTAVTAAIGNEGSSRHHFQGKIADGEAFETVELVVGTRVSGFSLELWGQQPDIFSVEIISPSGEKISRIPASYMYSRNISFILENTIIYYYHKLIETVDGGQVISLRFKNPTAGVWRIRVYDDNSLAGYYNMWLPVDTFLDNEVYFLNSSPYTTLLMPSASGYVITTTAYDYRNNSIWINSGRGNTANNMVKPDIAAPGVDIYGPVAGAGHNLYTRRSGTSIAAAHVAGAAALMFEWRNRNSQYSIFNTSDIKALLKIGARRDKNLSYPNREWGYGKLDLINTFLVLAGS